MRRYRAWHVDLSKSHVDLSLPKTRLTLRLRVSIGTKTGHYQGSYVVVQLRLVGKVGGCQQLNITVLKGCGFEFGLGYCPVGSTIVTPFAH